MESPNTEKNSMSAKLNQLRAAVLGANDGIVSTSSVVMGVAGATDSSQAIFTAGMAALVAGALSMAVGEYVSVSSQSDAEKAYIENEKMMLKLHPDEEFEQLVDAYRQRGISAKTARQVATELTEKDALAAHVMVERSLDKDSIVSPVQAAVASLISFTVGGLIPFVAVIVSPNDIKEIVTVVAVLIALLITGYFSATVGGASRSRAMLRVIAGGLLAMAITYVVGLLFGIQFS
ncbi:MAG TPA: VIT family protein [Candidatus Saccharibacteria bacterium]|nr:VIT family protein [Candidatus Saccharibacteria bacterium]